MQNRFTIKDFFYMLLGGVACALLVGIIWATNREASNVADVEASLSNQHQTLSSLNESIKRQQDALDQLRLAISEMRTGGSGIDDATLQRLANALGQPNPGTSNAGGTGTPVAMADEGVPSSQVNWNAVDYFQSGYDPRNNNPIHTDDQNREGKPQQWMTGPDSELPADFSTGDELIIAWPTDAQRLVPLVSTDAYSRRVFWYTSEYLINIDLDAPWPYTPSLAKAWHVSEDGMKITFYLNERARWWDGTPVTASDVVFTWDSAVNEQLDTAHLRSYIRDNVEDWEALDDYTVRFTMKQTYFDSVGITGNLLFIVPEHVYGDLSPEVWNNATDLCRGSGPYVLEPGSWKKNEEIVLSRNENYWGPKAPVDRIVIRPIEAELTQLQEFRANNLDFFAPVGEQWNLHKESDWLRNRGATARQYYSPRGGYLYQGYNLRRPQLSDKRTRQALTMLIDREAFIDSVYDGQGRVITGPFFFMSDQYDSSIEPWPYDPQRARELLAEVGWEDTDNDGILDKDLDGDGDREPFELTHLTPSGGTTGGKIQRFMKEAFQQAGIKLNLDQLEWSVFLERLDSRQYDMVVLSWTGNPEGDPHQIWHSDSEPNKGSNHVGFLNEEADRIIEKARTTIDRDERMKLWHEFHRILHEEQPYTFLTARPSRYFAHERFQNIEDRDYRPHYSEWFVAAPDQLR